MLKPKKKVRVNVRSLVNSADIRKEVRNGRDVIIVPSATLPDNVIMNRIKYPADEIGKGYKSLNRTPAPLGHPMLNGEFVSAKDPEGLNRSYIGAWNENVRRENGRVFLDKIIDVEVANQSEGGKSVLAAIEAGNAIHTSTGLLADAYEPEGDDHDFIARNMRFDHDAFLLGEEGAATPEQGVGVFVNAAGEKLEVVNCDLANSFASRAEEDLDWALESVARAIEKKQKASVLETLKSALLSVIPGYARETPAINLEGDADMKDEDLTALNGKLDAIADALAPETLGAAIGAAMTNALKPVTDSFELQAANAKAAEEAELAGYVATIVGANALTEETAQTLPLAAAKALAEKVGTKGKAAGLSGGFKNSEEDSDEFKDYDPNVEIDNATKKGG